MTVLHTRWIAPLPQTRPRLSPAPSTWRANPLGTATGPRSHFSVLSNRSIKHAWPTSPSVSPLNGVPSTSAPPYGSLLEALLLLVPKFAMLWRKGLARFSTSALHFARSFFMSALWPPPEEDCTAKKSWGTRATSEIGCSPQTGAIQS
ncbi:hypothetical protein M441DRAFT_406969 [Trichoderma asperellum CBS 433.97]|uniref:Uncharacterized protein n=1 Tax=Trichoderma asperellum (strain ATCC 204424 / CBS 433.97 / NBRC 101777) TaxID=1042311 RepID=A0A2T3Z6Q0_TRIA4|nr:hypothetical protein M441DRAFT_406969 [Trichoderma asperellum CBS 433.97]PTB40484.1 hypothetical protein M441DRAFT_406969 [Trichoderma asperellum CBS 433.97]